jgi:hypothetical protein
MAKPLIFAQARKTEFSKLEQNFQGYLCRLLINILNPVNRQPE